jgi:threonyl-tRNA synthetase
VGPTRFEKERAMIRVRLPDGSEHEQPRGACLGDAVKTLLPDMASLAVCACVDDEIRDLRDGLDKDCRLTFLTAASWEGARVVCHTAAHVVAHAATRVFPTAVLGEDPRDVDCFYVDLEAGRAIRNGDLERIQEEVEQIVGQDLPIERSTLSKGAAQSWLIRRGEVFKLEILERINATTVTVYTQAEFSDLCGGPHLLSTGRLPRIQLTAIEEATWRSDPAGEHLQRLCGVLC